MSVSKWAYSPEKCDGHICRGYCDICPLKDEDVGEREEDFESALHHGYGENWIEFKNKACEEALKVLSADAVATIQTGQTYGKSAYIKEFAEVIRCKDCRFLNKAEIDKKPYYFCRNYRQGYMHSVDLNGYCSWGERR